MITVASLLWDANDASFPFSRCYDESWVLKLYHGFARNLTVPWRFVLFTERDRDLPPEIVQERLKTATPSYTNCIEPFRFGTPMILVGLDTIIMGNVDHFAKYCLEAKRLALPRDPLCPERACTGVALIPEGHQCVYRNWQPGENDMDCMRKYPHDYLDDLYPGQVMSYRIQVKKHGLGDARIVYFHGKEKPHELGHVDWVRQHWRVD